VERAVKKTRWHEKQTVSLQDNCVQDNKDTPLI